MTTPSRRIKTITVPTSDFEQRVVSKHVDLFARIEEGLPPVEYLPGSEGMLVRGRGI